MTFTKQTLRVLFLTVVLCGCASRPYVLPVPDGSLRPSPPSLQGRIAAVCDGEIVVAITTQAGEASSTFPVRLGPRTQLFTVYGGVVTASDLIVGQRLRVWLDRPGPPKAGQTPTAAVVMLASKESSDEWP